MAEYCSQCSPDMSDIDLARTALYLERGKTSKVLCEGCGNRALYKDTDGRLFLLRQEKDGEVYCPVNYDDLLN